MREPIVRFIFEQLPKVRGYLDVLDALVFTSIAQAQRSRSFTGSAVEIGVFYGRSFFLLNYLFSPSKCLAVDPFDIGRNGKLLRQYEQFMSYSKLLQVPIDENLVVKAFSSDLDASTILEKAGPVGFFSIDGGHHLRDVAHDSTLAIETLTDSGVIAFDDSFNPEWPDVTVAIVDFLRSNPDFRTFCITDKKLYVCRKEFQEFYLDAMKKSPFLDQFVKTERDFMETGTLVLSDPVKRRIFARALDKIGLGYFAPKLHGLR